jgi:hypothetical protein
MHDTSQKSCNHTAPTSVLRHCRCPRKRNHQESNVSFKLPQMQWHQRNFCSKGLGCHPAQRSATSTIKGRSAVTCLPMWECVRGNETLHCTACAAALVAQHNLSCSSNTRIHSRTKLQHSTMSIMQQLPHSNSACGKCLAPSSLELAVSTHTHHVTPNIELQYLSDHTPNMQ